MRMPFWLDVDQRDLAKRAAGATPIILEDRWWCEYPEFADPGCLAEHDPSATRLPRKHTECGYVAVVVDDS